MHHIAIMRKSWGLLPKILTKEKTIESRWYMNKYSPWDRIKKGDIVYFKNSGEPISVKTEVSKIIQYSDLTSVKVKQILEEYGAKDGLGINEIDKYYQMFKDKKYCLLIFLKNPQKIKSFDIDKTGFGAMAAWITVDNIKRIIGGRTSDSPNMTNLMTKEQFNKKKKELDKLKKEYEKLGKKISGEAKDSGSFLHNIPGYVGLMDRMEALSLKIAQLEKELDSVQMISPKEIPSGVVSVLSCVLVLDILKNKKEKYCFGENISQDSLIGKALINKKVGDRVKVKTPKGERELEILEIEVMA